MRQKPVASIPELAETPPARHERAEASPAFPRAAIDKPALRNAAVAIIGAAALVAGAALPSASLPAAFAEDSPDTSTGQGTAVTDEWLPDVPLSSTIDGATIASGQLSEADGQAFGAGQPVALYGWPSAEVLDAMQIGESVKLTPLAKTVTDGDGSFELRLDDAAIAERLAGGDKLVDLQLQGWSADGLVDYSFTKRLTGGGTTADADESDADESDADASSSDELALEDVDDSAAADTDDLDLVAEEVEDDGSVPEAVDDVLEKSDVCGATKIRSYKSIDVVVGRMYSSTSGIAGSFALKNNAETTLGVGVSASGDYGEFKQNGSTTIKLEDSYTWEKRTLTGGRQYRTDFTYGEFSNWCYPVAGSHKKQVYSYTVRPTRWEGGGSYGTESVPSVANSKCRPFAAKSSQAKTTTNASATSGGVKISHIVGVNLSSKAGYSSTATAKIYNASAKQKKLCGTNGTPSSPGRFLAKG